MRSALDWFESLTGFYESSAAVVHAQLAMEGGRMTSRANGRERDFQADPANARIFFGSLLKA
jgi:hypothetical protein